MKSEDGKKLYQSLYGEKVGAHMFQGAFEVAQKKERHCKEEIRNEIKEMVSPGMVLIPIPTYSPPEECLYITDWGIRYLLGPTGNCLVQALWEASGEPLSKAKLKKSLGIDTDPKYPWREIRKGLRKLVGDYYKSHTDSAFRKEAKVLTERYVNAMASLPRKGPYIINLTHFKALIT